MIPCDMMLSRPYPDSPPLGGGGGVSLPLSTPCFSADGPRANRLTGRLRIQGNGTSGGVFPYRRFPVPSISMCRPLLTMRGGVDMDGRPFSPSYHCCSGGTLVQRGLSGRQTLPEGGNSLVTRQFHHWHIKVPLGY